MVCRMLSVVDVTELRMREIEFETLKRGKKLLEGLREPEGNRRVKLPNEGKRREKPETKEIMATEVRTEGGQRQQRVPIRN